MPEQISRIGARLFVLVQYLLPHHGLSRLIGLLAASRIPWIKTLLVEMFRRRYRVDLSEALSENPDDYPSFNAFFTRALKPGARPLAERDAVISPADGTISQIGCIRGSDLVQAKGRYYSLFELLGGDSSLAGAFINGRFATIYLAPRDYHRVHMPTGGILERSIHVPGRLFSVNSATTGQVPRLFARNERLISVFSTEDGPMAVIMVGAMIVAGIETVYAGRMTPRAREVQSIEWPKAAVDLKRGDELGRFLLGSTVITLLPQQTCRWDDAVVAGTPVQMGQRLGGK